MKSLTLRQRLEQQKLQLKQDEDRLRLETELTKNVRRDEILSKLQDAEFRDDSVTRSLRGQKRIEDAKQRIDENPKQRIKDDPIPHTLKLPQIPHRQPYETKRGLQDERQICDSQSEQIKDSFTASNPMFDFMMKLQTQQNDINQQQNEIMKGFADQQYKSSLPTPQVPLFDGDPMEYDNFIRAFENIIETKVKRDVERLYYLEQYTIGDAKELVKSCQHMAMYGYREARRLLEKTFGNPYKIASAYIEKLSKWPDLKSEDNKAPHKFAIFLVCCKNLMKGNAHLNKFDSVDFMQQVVLKLPFSMRCRWRRQVDDIMQTQQRTVILSDLAQFVEKEARIATHPVFGNVQVPRRPTLNQ